MAIKSHSIKIGADTAEFTKGLKAADRSIKATANEAKELEKGLKFEWNEKRFVRAQQLAQKALDDTEKKAQAIRDELKYLEEAGAIDTAGYQKLQTELIKVENQAVLAKQKLEEINKLKFDQLGKSFQDVGDKISKAGKALLPFSAAAAGVLVGMGKLAKDAVDAGDEIQTLADQHNLSTKAIQQWQYIAMQTDVPADKLFKSAVKIRDAFGAQMTGTVNTATKALDALGVNIANFNGTEAAFEGTLIALSQVEDSTLQAYYANEIFGEKVATDLIPLLNAGETAIREYSKEFEAVGYLSDENVKKLAEMDNALNKATKQFEQAKLELGIALIPILQIFVDILTNHVVPIIKSLAEWFENLSPGMQKTIVTVLAIIAALGPLLIVVGKMISAIGTIIKIIPTLGKLIDVLGTKIGRAFISAAAFGYAIKLIFDVMNAWGDMNAWQKIISVLGILTIVALGAAIAMGAFHSAWSLGLAVAGIIAGIIAVTAAVNSAKDSVEGLDVPDYAEPSVTGGSNAGDYQMPEIPDMESIAAGGATGGYIDNSVMQGDTNVTINVYAHEGMDTQEIVDEINRQFRDKKMAFG